MAGVTSHVSSPPASANNEGVSSKSDLSVFGLPGIACPDLHFHYIHAYPRLIPQSSSPQNVPPKSPCGGIYIQTEAKSK